MTLDLKKKEWKEFDFKEIFPKIQRGKRLRKADHRRVKYLMFLQQPLTMALMAILVIMRVFVFFPTVFHLPIAEAWSLFLSTF